MEINFLGMLYVRGEKSKGWLHSKLSLGFCFPKLEIIAIWNHKHRKEVVYIYIIYQRR